MPETSTPTHSPHASRQHFYLGFLTGAVIGVGIALLSVSKKGGNLRKELLLQGKELAGKLPEFIEDLVSQLDNQTESASQQVHHITEVLSSDPDEESEPVVEEKSTENAVQDGENAPESITKAMVKTASKAKRFFSKAGRLLRK